MDIEKMKAEFAAKGGTVTKIPTGQSLNLTPKDWKRLSGWTADVIKKPHVEIDDEQLAERRRELAHDAHFVGDHDFANEVMSGAYDRELKEKN